MSYPDIEVEEKKMFNRTETVQIKRLGNVYCVPFDFVDLVLEKIAEKPGLKVIDFFEPASRISVPDAVYIAVSK